MLAPTGSPSRQFVGFFGTTRAEYEFISETGVARLVLAIEEVQEDQGRHDSDQYVDEYDDMTEPIPLWGKTRVEVNPKSVWINGRIFK